MSIYLLLHSRSAFGDTCSSRVICTTFVLCFKRFAARRGLPQSMVSENAKTLTLAKRLIQKATDTPIVKKFFSKSTTDLGI